MSKKHKDQENVQHEIETDAISTRRRAEKKHGGGADRDNNSYEGGVAGVAGTGGSSGVGSVRANVEGMGSLSGISPELEEGEAPMPGSIGKHPGGTRDHQLSDGGLPGKSSGAGGDTVPSQKGGKKGQTGQRDGHQSNKSQR
jgi:hypothetical protein